MSDRSKTKNVVFAPAQPCDVDALVELVNSAYRGEISRQGWTTEADLLEGLRVDAASLGVLLNQNDSRILLATLSEHENRLLGSIHLQAQGECVELGMFAVSPWQQGLGIGKQLLQVAEQFAVDTWQAKRAVMSVIDSREELIAFYQRRGYQLTGKYKAFPVNPALWTQKVAHLRLALLEKVLA